MTACFMKTQFEYKKRIKNRGYYASIVLDIQKKDTNGVEIIFDKESIWYSTLNYGATYLSEHLDTGKEGSCGYSVVVNELNTMMIDSSSIVVLYVFIKAFFEALGYQDELIEINDEGWLVLRK